MENDAVFITGGTRYLGRRLPDEKDHQALNFYIALWLAGERSSPSQAGADFAGRGPLRRAKAEREELIMTQLPFLNQHVNLPFLG